MLTKQHISAVLVCVTSLTFASAFLSSCDDKVVIDELKNVSVDYTIDDGVILEGKLVKEATIELTVNADVSGKEVEIIISDTESSYSISQTAITGKPLMVSLTDGPFTKAGTYRVSITIPNRLNNQFLWKSPTESISVLDISQVECVLSVRNNDEDWINYKPGQTIQLKTGSLGTFIATANPLPSQGLLHIESSMPKEALTLVEMESNDDNSLKYHFIAGEKSEGTISVCLDINEFEIPFQYNVSISHKAEPDPGPSGSVKATLSGPEFAFIGDKYTASLSCSDTGSDRYDVKYFLDDSPTGSSQSGIVLPSKTDITVPLDNVSSGNHVLRVVITPSGSATPTADASLPFTAFSFDCSWYEYPSQVPIKQNILHSKAKSSFLLSVDLGASSSVSMTATDEGKTLSPVGGSSGSTRKCILESPKRGSHTITLTFSDGSGHSVSKTTQAACYDIFLCEYSVEGSNIYAALTGPASSAPTGMDFTISGQLVGVIPYTEAVEYFGEHYLRNDYEYSYYDVFEKEFAWSSGEALGKKKIWSGWITTAAKYAQGKLSDLKVTRKATRWVQNGNTYTKEYYTPTPYMQVTVVLKMKKGSISNPDYLKLNYEYSSLSQFVSEYGLKLYVNIQ